MKFRILILILFPFVLNAQQYDFKQYSKNEGLAHNQVFDLIQTSDGHIWVATLGGLSVFNGSNFKTYKEEDGLPSNLIVSLFEDSKKRLWVGTINNGVCYIDNDKIVRQDFDHFKYGAVNEFLEGPDGRIYAFANSGIIEFKNNTSTVLSPDLEKGNSYLSSDVIWIDDNKILIASNSRGVLEVSLNPFLVTTFADDASHNINNICYSIYKDDDGIWIGSYGALYRFQDGVKTEYIPDPNDFNANRIWHITADGPGHLFMVTEGNGILRFNKRTETFKNINSANGMPNSFSYRHIIDTEGNYWIGTLGSGLVRFRDDAFAFYDESNGFKSKVINAVVPWNDGWAVGTDNGLSFMNDGSVLNTQFENEAIIAVTKTHNNKILVATETEAYLFDSPYSKKLVAEGAFLDVYMDEKVSFFVGFRNLLVQTADTTFTRPFRRSFKTLPLGDGHVFGKLAGLLQYNNFIQDTIPGMFPKEHSLIFSMDTINKNELLVLNDMRIYHLLREGKEYTKRTFDLKRFTGVKDAKAMRVQGDNLWIASRNTFSKVRLPKLLKEDSVVITNYRNNTGFVTNEIDNDNLVVDANGIVFGATDEGLIAFNENAFKTTNIPPKLALASVQLFSEELQDSLYRKEDGIVLPYTKNYLTFAMEAITFTYPETVRYKYRLKGLREGDPWSEATSKNEVVFSYLPPGEYQFEFIADNGNGIWQENAEAYPFEITIPFWRSWWFWFGTLLCLGFIIILILERRAKAKQRQQEQFSQDLINAQEQERTRVARELHDSVGQKLMLLSKKTKGMGDKSVDTLADGTLAELRSISRGLHPSILEDLGLTAAIESMVNEVDANTKIFFTNDIENIDNVLSKEASLHLYRIIQEVLNNMVKHADAKAASVVIDKNQNAIIAEIKDNGKGFEIAEGRKARSLGMKTLRERAKILRSNLQIKSDVNVGTIIRLDIPL